MNQAKKPKTVFLDLEETIIDDFRFWSGILMNVERIKTFIVKETPDRVAIFSHALDNVKDVAFAQKKIFPEIERVLEVKLDLALTPTIESLVQTIGQQKHFLPGTFTTEEFFDFFGKKESFELFVKGLKSLQGHECVLVDDSVDNMVISHLDTDTVLRLVQVNSL